MAVNKLVEMLGVDKSEVKNIIRLSANRQDGQPSARPNPGVGIIEFESSEDQIMEFSNTKLDDNVISLINQKDYWTKYVFICHVFN